MTQTYVSSGQREKQTWKASLHFCNAVCNVIAVSFKYYANKLYANNSTGLTILLEMIQDIILYCTGE